MLQLLKVANFALIEQAEIEFADGFNVLTGETGAGKSIVVDALSVVLGGRSSVEMVRGGSEQFRVEAVFETEREPLLPELLSELGIPAEEDGRLIVSRSVSRQGKNTVLINGTHAPLSLLRNLGSKLLDMHGQHENQALLRAESYLDLLDGSDPGMAALLKEYRFCHEKWRKLVDKISSIDQDERQRAQRLDMLQWQTEEIEAARLKPEEETELPQQILLLTHAEKIRSAVGLAWSSIADEDRHGKGVISVLQESRRQLDNATRFDSSLGQFGEQLAQILVQLEDLAPGLREYLDQVEFDPVKLSRLQERMDLIYRLKQKYGATVAEVMEYARNGRVEMSELTRHDELVQELRRQLEKQAAELEELAADLHRRRLDAAGAMGALVESHLRDLGMPGGRFAVCVDLLDKFTSTGKDAVRFEFSANPGEELMPLAKVASGGELSRVALAIKTVCIRNDGAQVMVFDEIDAGVGGHTARKVAEKIAGVAWEKQVLCITHLPQIASMADCHIHIEKRVVGERTQTFVRVLPEAERLQELARMIGGEPITPAGLDNATEMVKTAAQTKQQLRAESRQKSERRRCEP